MTGAACGRWWRQVSILAALCCLAGGPTVWAAAVPDVKTPGEEVYEFVQKVAPKLCLASACIDVSAVPALQNTLNTQPLEEDYISVHAQRDWLRWAEGRLTMHTIYIAQPSDGAQDPLLQADFNTSICELMPRFAEELCKYRSKWSFAYIWSIISGKDDLVRLGQVDSSAWQVSDSCIKDTSRASSDVMAKYLVRKALRNHDGSTGRNSTGVEVPPCVQQASWYDKSIPYEPKKGQQETLTLWELCGKIAGAIPGKNKQPLSVYSVHLRSDALPSGASFRGVLLIVAMLMIAGAGLYKYVYVPGRFQNRAGTAGAVGGAGK